jgi:hypothetical protein
MHLIALHDSAGSGNPLGVSANYDRLPFAPYFIFQDCYGTAFRTNEARSSVDALRKQRVFKRRRLDASSTLWITQLGIPSRGFEKVIVDVVVVVDTLLPPMP